MPSGWENRKIMLQYLTVGNFYSRSHLEKRTNSCVTQLPAIAFYQMICGWVVGVDPVSTLIENASACGKTQA